MSEDKNLSLPSVKSYTLFKDGSVKLNKGISLLGAQDTGQLGYSISVASYSGLKTSKLRTFVMSEMEVEFDIEEFYIKSLVFKDTSVHKKLTLKDDGTGNLVVVDGYDTVGEHSDPRPTTRTEVVDNFTINDNYQYQVPFDLKAIYEDLTGDVVEPPQEDTIDEDSWWQGLSYEKVHEILGIEMEKEQFQKAMELLSQDGVIDNINAFLKGFANAKEQVEKSAQVQDEPCIIVAKALDEEKKETVEVIYKPSTKDEDGVFLKGEKDAHDEWMTEEEIEKAKDNFNENLEKGTVHPNLFHFKNTDKFSIVETWTTKVEGYYGEDKKLLPKGTWLARIKFEDDDLWEMKKSGELGGLSYGGFANVNPETGEITNLVFDDIEKAVLAFTEESLYSNDKDELND